MAKKYLLTKEGVEKLEKELKFLMTTRREEVTDKIKEAISFGDLSENAAYSQAKEEQAFIEGRILEIENMLKNVDVVGETSQHEVVEIGSMVVLNVNGKEKKYKIVGRNEANPNEGRISNESLVGKAVLGKKAGDKFRVSTLNGDTEYEVKEIE
jgi:transcription elongation factor GreA